MRSMLTLTPKPQPIGNPEVDHAIITYAVYGVIGLAAIYFLISATLLAYTAVRHTEGRQAAYRTHGLGLGISAFAGAALLGVQLMF